MRQISSAPPAWTRDAAFSPLGWPGNDVIFISDTPLWTPCSPSPNQASLWIWGVAEGKCEVFSVRCVGGVIPQKQWYLVTNSCITQLWTVTQGVAGKDGLFSTRRSYFREISGLPTPLRIWSAGGSLVLREKSLPFGLLLSCLWRRTVYRWPVQAWLISAGSGPGRQVPIIEKCGNSLPRSGVKIQ